ncbi:hypothetical protein TNCV_4444061 [Trichonephila clavipes]|nr:hypothetical protein TNCV_4444061 [Trichonephila clavipes]
MVKRYFWWYSPKRWEFRTICLLATCDDRLLRTGLGLPPYTIITFGVKRQQSIEPVCAIVSYAHLFVSGDCLYEYLTTHAMYCLLGEQVYPFGALGGGLEPGQAGLKQIFWL